MMLQRLKNTLPRFTLMAGALWMLTAGCSLETGTFRSAITGEECVPDESYVPRDLEAGEHGPPDQDRESQGNTSPTGIPGDNLDDQRSGKVDCLGDGNSGQGDDKKHNCEFPPGCDDSGCCDVDVLPDEPGDEPQEPQDPEEPADGDDGDEPADGDDGETPDDGSGSGDGDDTPIDIIG